MTVRWMGVVFFLVVLLGPAELIRWGWLEWGDLEAGSRLLLSRVIAGTSVGGALAMSAVALYQGLRRVGITRISVPLHGLPAELRGFKIVQLSDVHVGPTIGADFVEALVEQTNALEPDLIAITGDLVDGSVAQLGHLLTGLRGLRARHGVYFVTGNHEYYSGASAWVEHLSELGIRVLRNEAVSLDRGEVRLHLAGVDDWTAHQFPDGHGADIDAALDGVPAGEPVVLLAHQPRQFPSAAERGVALGNCRG